MAGFDFSYLGLAPQRPTRKGDETVVRLWVPDAQSKLTVAAQVANVSRQGERYPPRKNSSGLTSRVSASSISPR